MWTWFSTFEVEEREPKDCRQAAMTDELDLPCTDCGPSLSQLSPSHGDELLLPIGHPREGACVSCSCHWLGSLNTLRLAHPGSNCHWSSQGRERATLDSIRSPHFGVTCTCITCKKDRDERDVPRPAEDKTASGQPMKPLFCHLSP
ncbi:hypothetical protein VDGL01_01964 [Verticillium dahliae]